MIEGPPEPRRGDAQGTLHEPPAGLRNAAPASEDALSVLRGILVGEEQARVRDVASRVQALEDRLGSDEALMEAMAPLMHAAIRRQIQDGRAELIEALHPIIGALIGRAVAEAMRDLARQVDARVRQTTNPRLWWWRLRARLGGADAAELTLRQYLPFSIAELFLLHGDSGLLIYHASRRPGAADADLIGGMLSAIRSFAGEAFGGDEAGGLDEIQHGSHRILIEAGRYTLLAVDVAGVEPPGFRDAMRRVLDQVEGPRAEALSDYAGDASTMASAQPMLADLMQAGQIKPLGRSQRIALGGLALLALATVGCALAGSAWAWRGLRPAPAALAVATATPLPLSSATLPPSTPVPAPRSGVLIGNAWLREGPAADARPIRVMDAGTQVELAERQGDWQRVRWRSETGGELAGWISAAWITEVGGAAPTTSGP